MSQNNISNFCDLSTTTSPGSANCRELPTQYPIVVIQRLTYASAFEAALELSQRIENVERGRLHLRNGNGDILLHMGQVLHAILNDDLMIGGVE